MIRSGAYKLTVDYHSYRPMMLFDMEQDPFELNDLVEQEAYSQTVCTLSELLRKNTYEA